MSLVQIFIGPAHAVFYAVLEWSGGETYTSIDGRKPDEVREIFNIGLFSERRRYVIFDIDKTKETEGGFLQLSKEVEVCGVVIKEKPTSNKTVEKLGEVVLCDKKWAEKTLRQSFSKKNIKVDSETCKLISEKCSDDYGKMRSVVEIAHMAGVSSLDRKGALKLIGSTKPEAKIYEICDHLFDEDLEKALFKGESIEDVPLCMIVSEQTRLLLAARESKTVDEFASFYKMHPFVAKKRYMQAKKYKREDIISALSEACSGEIAVRRRERGGAENLVRVFWALKGRGAQRAD